MRKYNDTERICIAVYNTYECEIKAIYDVVNSYSYISYNKFLEIMKKLKGAGFLDIQKINIGIRGGIKNIVLATKKGEMYTMNIYNEILQEREAEKLKRVHTTLEHGYLVKYVCNVLTEFNPTDDYYNTVFETTIPGKSGTRNLVSEVDFTFKADKKNLFV